MIAISALARLIAVRRRSHKADPLSKFIARCSRLEAASTRDYRIRQIERGRRRYVPATPHDRCAGAAACCSAAAVDYDALEAQGATRRLYICIVPLAE